MNNISPVVFLSFDVEEWFQVENLRSCFPKENWHSQPSTVEKNTSRILEILSEFEVTATFFVLGSVSENHPNLIKRIAQSGHEIASHGFGHEISSRLPEDQLREDISKSKTTIENITGKEVVGYRAPNFSVDQRVLSILKEFGFKYDSSYNPFSLNPRYGKLDITAEDSGNGIMKLENGLYEFPITVVKTLGIKIPIGGGAYFRIMPLYLFRYFVINQIKKQGYYSFYLHPWEFEPEQPRMKSLRWDYRLRHYTGLANTAKNLKKLIASLKKKCSRFFSMQKYLEISGGQK